MADNNVNNIKNKPVAQSDRNGQTVTIYPNNGQPMIMIEPKQINTLSEDK
jgi:hypothetical protein